MSTEWINWNRCPRDEWYAWASIHGHLIKGYVFSDLTWKVFSPKQTTFGEHVYATDKASDITAARLLIEERFVYLNNHHELISLD